MSSLLLDLLLGVILVSVYVAIGVVMIVWLWLLIDTLRHWREWFPQSWDHSDKW